MYIEFKGLMSIAYRKDLNRFTDARKKIAKKLAVFLSEFCLRMQDWFSDEDANTIIGKLINQIW